MLFGLDIKWFHYDMGRGGEKLGDISGEDGENEKSEGGDMGGGGGGEEMDCIISGEDGENEKK
jgi:hypothetical protein